MSWTIRRCTPDDYEALAALCNSVEPDFPTTAAELRFEDEHRDPRALHGRLLAEADGRPIGHASWGQPGGMLHEGVVWIGLGVAPEERRRGVGGALFDRLEEELRAVGARELRADAQETRADSLRFLERRGFVECMREWESRLDLRAWNPDLFADREARAAAGGIELRTYPELSDDPDRHRKLFDLTERVEQDIPSPDPPTPRDFALWTRKTLANPAFVPETWAIAVHEGRYVGVSLLWKPAVGGYLETGLTGVDREYRRRGLAFALKVRALRAARALGIPEVRTWNATTNEGMLAINGALGFVRQPAWLFFKRG